MRLVVVFFCLAVIFPAQAANSKQDPWENFNRTVFSFNETVDKYTFKPITKGYQAVTPDVVEQGVANVLSNLDDVLVMANNLLQLELAEAASDLARISLNTTLGIYGLFDVATVLGIEKNNEDFGQTLGYWGVESGPYVVLPFFGASTLRDAAGLSVDLKTNPSNYIHDQNTKHAVRVLGTINKRADLFKAEALISGDRYSFIRDAYLQQREFLINNGEVEEDYSDDNF